MGAFSFMMDMAHSSKLGDHDDEITKLRQEVEILKQWVVYLNEQLEAMKNEI